MLVATSEFGCADTMYQTITVKESPKTSYINTPLCSVKPTDFTNTSKAVSGATADYTWDFGDGTQANTYHATHTYQPGYYNACLIVSNACGADTLCQNVFVCAQLDAGFGYSSNHNSISYVKDTTKKVFGKLIKSFSKIGNEARKDSKILQKASSTL